MVAQPGYLKLHWYRMCRKQPCGRDHTGALLLLYYNNRFAC